MRLIPLIAISLSVVVSGPAFAQGWIDYVNRADLFAVNFPGEPKAQDISYQTQYSLTLPGHVYSVADGRNRYSVTVVDYTDVEKKHAERLKNCKAELGDGDSCNNPARGEMRGAIIHATWNLIQRNAKLTHLTYTTADLVEGNQIQLANADGSRTFAAVYMHENRLYILEGTVPAGSPAPGLFQQSLQFLDKEGNRIRYQTPYANGFPVPPHIRYR
jgi:hypothetical protein